GTLLTLDVTDLSVQINTENGALTVGASSTPASALDWTTALDLNSDNGFGQANDQLVVHNNTTGTDTTIDLKAELIQASGTATVTVANRLASGSVPFSFSQVPVNVLPATGATILPNATLTRLGLQIVGTGFLIG